MILDKISAALKQLELQGSFSAKITTDANDLDIEIQPIGRLTFPLNSSVAKKLIKEARPATFGWQDKTCLDTEVRDVWEIPKSRVKIDKRRWNKTLNPAVRRLKGELGLPEQGRLRAELHDVLIYAPGQFFLPHQDSEKCDGMVATLVVVLPSPHRGGTLIVDHQGEKARYQSSRTAAGKLTFVAFYADCRHEVRPVKEGYRVALTYNLILEGGDEKIVAPTAALTQQSLIEALGNYFGVSSSDRGGQETSKKLVYLLDHEYTPKGISWKTLKNGDWLRVSALSEAASVLDLEMHLALADIQEIWNCEVEAPSWGYGSRRRYWCDYDELEDEGDAELLDLIDDSTTLKHWRDAAGEDAGLPEWYARGGEICWTKPNDRFNPFRSEYEGWMGNYGNTMERWYHRAAIVLWRREDHYAALLEIAPDKLVRELLRLAQKKTTRPQAQETVRCLLPNWSGLKKSATKSSSFSPVFRLALRLDVSDLARELLLPLCIDALCPETVPFLIRLQTAYGVQWLIDVIHAWLESSPNRATGRTIHELSPIIKRWVEQAPGGHGELTHWLLHRQLGALQQKHIQQAQVDNPVNRLKNARGRVEALLDLLSASFLSLDNAIFNKTIDHLIANESAYLVLDLLEIARYVKQQSQQAGATERHRARFLGFVRTKLTMALDRPPRRGDDWSIMEKNRCECGDCQVLKAFLQSSGLNHKIWPLAKRRRQHVHQVVDAMGIPVTHRTERSGSPHKLHLKKTEQLFRQDQELRVRLKRALNDLTEEEME